MSHDQEGGEVCICDPLALHQGHTVPDLFHDGLFSFSFFFI